MAILVYLFPQDVPLDADAQKLLDRIGTHCTPIENDPTEDRAAFSRKERE